MVFDALGKHFKDRELQVPSSLRTIYDGNLVSRLGPLLLSWNPDGGDGSSVLWAEELTAQSAWPLLPNLVPFMALDEQSFACVVASGEADEPLPGAGAVVRWHVGVTKDEHQAALLDTDCLKYAESVAEEMADRAPGLKQDARAEGLDRVMGEIGPAYMATYISREKRPRDFVVRPVRLACQNLIIGLAAFAQESSFDGLSVLAWQTCEVPHVAAHEANRALAVLTLCDAFQNGGTMEVRFDRAARVVNGPVKHSYVGHPEKRVPASLRRLGRTVGVELGQADPSAITPTEARRLFLAITPMPERLRARVLEASESLGISPERLCYSLLAPIWRDIELDFLLATSARAASILSGGADWTDRSARQAESESCRAAVMVGMYFRRLNSTDSAGSDGQVRVVESKTVGVQWDVDASSGSVRLSGFAPDAVVPWTREGVSTGEIQVFPRTMVTAETMALAAASAIERPTAIMLPTGAAQPVGLDESVLVLWCPDRLPDIDKTIEANLLKATVSRG